MKIYEGMNDVALSISIEKLKYKETEENVLQLLSFDQIIFLCTYNKKAHIKYHTTIWKEL